MDDPHLYGRPGHEGHHRHPLCRGAGANHQHWWFDDLGNGFYRIRNVNSGKCLNVQGASSANGTDLIQFNCQALAASNSMFTWRRPPY